jgi:hypothetical protein
MVTQNDNSARRVEVITPTDYEAIGRLARNYYVAEVERVNARNARNRERASHRCACEGYPSEPPCWIDSKLQPASEHVKDWCENCQHVQPYYLAYQEAAKKARAARYSMTRAIQRKMLSEAEE